ncbi:hypothetical protein [Actinoplanes sp. NPDC049802]|uniref:hypothetical protein n=1 Tax=Actinoplanes sp. NPDC049802 TaxID=3154742 RepID=UPI0033F753C5
MFLALCFNIVGTAIYVGQNLRGEVKPHLVTFFLWSLPPLVAFTAQLTEGAGVVSLVTLVAGLNPALIFVIALRRPDAHWSASLFDVICGLLSLIGILAWWVSREGLYAIAFAIAADLLASLPTFRKSFIHPESESPALYAFSTISAAITLLSIQNWTFSHFGFAAYLLLTDFGLALIIGIRGHLKRVAPQK